ncbi:hypothetical protein ACJX0J_017126, partial [Zea mays]
DPTALRRAQDEVDRVLQGRLPKYEDVLLRRAIVDDVLPGNYKVKAGQDIMISVYNIHRSPEDAWLYPMVERSVYRCLEFLPKEATTSRPHPWPIKERGWSL